MQVSNQALAQDIKRQVLAELQHGVPVSGTRSSFTYNDLVATVQQKVEAQMEPTAVEGPTQPLSYQDLALADQVKRDVLARIEAERNMYPPGFVDSITRDVITELEHRQEATSQLQGSQANWPAPSGYGQNSTQYDPALVESIKRDVLMELRTQPRH